MIRELLIVTLVLAPQLAFALGRNEVDYAAQNMGVRASAWDVKESVSAQPKPRVVKRSAPPQRRPTTYLTNPKTARKMAALERAKRRDIAEPTDEELAAAVGVKADGKVSNASVPAFTFTLDSFAAWVDETERLKVGVSLGDDRLTWYPWSPEHPVTLTLDITDDLVGASVNLVLVPVIRLGLGIGYGRLFDIDENTWYAVGRVRLW